jgi:hypothetical protein
MLDPLSDAVVTSLRTNETAALAAAMVIAGSFPEVLAFAARVIGGPRRPEEPEEANPPKRARGRPRRGNGSGNGRERALGNATTGWPSSSAKRPESPSWRWRGN